MATKKAAGKKAAAKKGGAKKAGGAKKGAKKAAKKSAKKRQFEHRGNSNNNHFPQAHTIRPSRPIEGTVNASSEAYRSFLFSQS